MAATGAARVDVSGFGYTHPGRAQPVFSGLDLHLDPGERVLLLGPSGGGKSTLLLALAGVLGSEEAQESGEILLDGVPSRQARGRAGLMQQDPETQVILPRVGDDVAFGAENLSVPPQEIERRVTESLHAVGLDVSWNHSSSQLSGGQKQRLALAGILAMSPGLVLLDEPTANLDPAGVREVVGAVERSLADRSSTLLVVEHRVQSWLPLMDRVVVLDAAGHVIADGPGARVIEEQSEYLAGRGVWVPGWTPEPVDFGAVSPGPVVPIARSLLEAEELVIGRKTALPGSHTLTLGEGSRTVVTGPNGAGKSTLALTLGGLLKPLGGRLHAMPLLAAGARQEPSSWKPKELIGRIGSVFQEPEHQFVTNSVAEELAFGLRNSARRPDEAAIQARVAELLDQLGLTDLAEANPFTLSGGQKRRLSVATVMALRPQLLILDEPTFGQDTLTWVALVDLLAGAVQDGAALLAVTHDALFAEAIGAAEYRVGGEGRVRAELEGGQRMSGQTVGRGVERVNVERAGVQHDGGRAAL